MTAGVTDRPARVLIGGVGYRWNGDESFGLVAVDALARESWPAHISIQDLGYGALYAALDLADASPRYDRVVLLGGVARGRVPGDLYVHYDGHSAVADDDELQARIREAGAGVLSMDHLLVIGRYFGGLPDEVVRIELEPAGTGDEAASGAALSAAAAARLPDALRMARQEALAPRRAPAEGARAFV